MVSRPRRGTAFACALAAALAVSALIASCDAVLGTNDFTYGDCADAGAHRCLASDAGAPQSQVCDSTGHWVTTESAQAVRIDLLLMIGNAPSMAEYQQILATTVPDLVGELVNPPCIDSKTGQSTAMQPSGPLETCPAGAERAYPGNLDIHIGMITSSLGTFGADGCAPVPSLCLNGAMNSSVNDQGHLVTRTDPCGSTPPEPSYDNEGFLAWDPAQTLKPPGIADTGTLEASVGAIVTGAGGIGCGFQSQNEAWYRFLVDPSPYESISLDDTGSVVTTGLDETLLQQRKEFLRKDSLLVIVVLTSKTDGSIQEDGQYPLFAQTNYPSDPNMPFYLPRARQECSQPPPAAGPSDLCCASCAAPTPPGCPPTEDDPICSVTLYYDGGSDNIDLHAFGLSGGLTSHKARYGIEWFYPPSRYVQALTSQTVKDAMGNTKPNPIFADNPGGDLCARDPSRVFYVTITGVPWQLIARQGADGGPDLVDGVDPLDPSVHGGFKTFAELSLKDVHGNTFWDDIAGDPEHYVLPVSPFMQESTVPRSGVDPITNIAISPASSPNGTNPINGHEWNIASPPGDIEYACVFDLPKPIDCSIPEGYCSCSLSDGGANNPLCDPNPSDNGEPTLQTRAKAYPGVKNLAIARGLGNQGIVASICPAQLTDDTRPDYAYRPAIGALVARLKQQ
jgi:hypothetical protein